MALLTIRDLSLGYDSHTIASNLNFSVSSKDYLCIVGENGSGKTTLMKALLNLQEPIGGQILVGDGLKANEIGYLPQQTIVQRDFPASVKEIVLSGCQGRCGLRPFYSKKEKQLAWENMERMGIAECAGRCYRELSGGQKQRVLLARALCATRKILLLDEPTAGLNDEETMTMMDEIRMVKEKMKGSAVIIIEHDMQVMEKVPDSIVVFNAGMKIAEGTYQEIINDQDVIDAYIGGGEEDE